MPGRLRIVALICALLPALGLGACGGAAEREALNAYVAKVNAAQNEFASEVTTVSQQITRKSSAAKDRKTLKKFETAIDDVVTDLRAIDVPQKVRTEHDQLVSAMADFGAQISTATTALDKPTTRSIAEAQRSIATATQTVNAQIDAAIAAINSKLGAT